MSKKGWSGENKQDNGDEQQKRVLKSLINANVLILSKKDKVSLAKPYLNRILLEKLKTSDEMLGLVVRMLIEKQKISEDDLGLSISVVETLLGHFGVIETEKTEKKLTIPKDCEDEGVDYMSMF